MPRRNRKGRQGRGGQNRGNRLLTRPERREMRQIRRNEGRGAARDYRQGAIQDAYGADFSRYNLRSPEGALGAQMAMTDQQRQQLIDANRIGQTDQYGNQITYDAQGNQVVTQGGIGGQITDWVGGQMGNAMNQFSQPFSYEGMQQLGGVEEMRQGMSNQIYDQYAQDVNQQWDLDLERFNQRMAELGRPVGSEAYETELGRMTEDRDEALNHARTQAAREAGAEAQRVYGQQLGTRQQQIGEAQYTRGLPLSEMGQMQAFGQGFGPQFQNFAQVQSPYADVTGAALGFGNLGLGNRTLQQQLRLANMGGGEPMAPVDNWDRNEARRREAAMWNWQNNPQYQQQGGSGGLSPGAQIGIGAGAGLASGIGAGLGNLIAGF